MLDKLSFGLAVAAGLAFNAKLMVTSSVADLQRDVAERQKAIAASQLLGQVNGRLIQMMATASVERNDQSLRNLLARNGVQFSVNPAPAGRPVGLQPAAPAPEQPN